MKGSKSLRLAFIGLGTMGFPMAGHLADNGFDVIIYNRTPEKCHAWLKKHAGTIAYTPKEATQNAQIIFTCVGNDHDLWDVFSNKEGISESIQPNAILVDHTTTSADIAQKLAMQCQLKGAFFIDAPVSGGQQGAQKGCLTIMCGGENEAFETVKPLLFCYARAVTLMGTVGCGQLTKMVNQICVAGLIQSLAEGIQFATKAGLDPKKVIEVISKGAAQSWQMENRSATMINNEYDHGFAVEWMRKDLGICLAAAQKIKATLPITAIVDKFYAEIETMGGKRWDTSSLLTRMMIDS